MRDRDETPDAELIARCQSGDQQAWEVLVGRYERLVYTIPRRYGLNSAECDDVFQSTWLALLQHMPTLREPARVSAWLVTTAKRECWDRRRRSAHGANELSDPQLLTDNLPVHDQSPDQLVEEHETHQRVHAALARLGARCRDLLRLLYLAPNRPNYADIATTLNMKTGAIGPTRARCLAKLRQLMEESA
jgi:RNA polymerase sigma factor (sigma-70 family)